jgi:hypothetical protein
LYAFLLAFFMQYHELWFDETEPWLLALYSDSYADLLYNKRFEGHPNLWYSLLFVVTRFTKNLIALKVTQWACAVGFVYVFLRNAPFSWAFKLLFCFGYYGLFEFGLISRLYAIELLTLYLICSYYPKRFTHWYGYIFLLVLNAQTNLFGFFMSGILGLLLFSEAFKIWKESPNWTSVSNVNKIAGTALWTLGCLFSFWSMLRPNESSGSFLTFLHPYYFFQSAARPWQAFVPIPSLVVNFWNTSLLKNAVEIPLSGLLFLVILAKLFSIRRIFLAALLLFFCMFLFFFLKMEGSIRHHSHYFIFTLAFFWISTYYLPKKPLNSLFERLDRLMPSLLTVCVFTQVLAGMYALYIEINYPFYPGKQVATFLKTLQPNTVILTEDAVTSSNIAAYYGQPLYHLPSGNYQSFYILNFWEDHAPRKFVLLDWATAIAQQNNAPVIFIFRYEIPYQWHAAPVKFLKAYKGDYINPYSFYIYEIQPLPLPKKQITAEPPVGGVEK